MASPPADTVREIESLVTDWLHEERAPGASVVVVEGDGELYAEGFGSRDVESNAPATPDTLYGMGSISKSVTALAVLQLAEAGALSVEDAVDDYVDHYEPAPGEPITVAELLTHTSGMPSAIVGTYLQVLEGVPAGIADDADLERFVRDSASRRTTDGERFMYNNTGYVVLGELIEAVDGRPFATYAAEEIFEPLGMERASFDAAVLEEDDDAMTAYVLEGEEEPPEAKPFPMMGLRRPAGGLVASPRELGTYLRAMMTDGSVGSARVLSAEGVERLQEGRTVDRTFVDGSESEYGYGWERYPLGDAEAVGHAGNNLVSSAYTGYVEGADVGVVVATNCSPGEVPTGDLGMAVLALLTGQESTAVPGYAFKEKCEAVAGTYEKFRADYTVTVERGDGSVELTFADPVGEEWELTAFPTTLDPSDHEFYTVTGEGERAPVEFDLDGDRADLYFLRSRYRRVGPGG